MSSIGEPKREIRTGRGSSGRAFRRALIGSTALVGITIVAGPAAILTVLHTTPALADGGAGGAGAGGTAGGAGGASNTGLGGDGGPGTADANGGSGGGGGGSGADASATPRPTPSGGNGGANSAGLPGGGFGSPNPANGIGGPNGAAAGDSGGGGGAGAFNQASAGSVLFQDNLGTFLGGNGGAGGNGNGTGGGGGGGSGGAGVLFGQNPGSRFDFGAGDTLQGGVGGAGGTSGTGTGGSGGDGGAGLQTGPGSIVVNPGTFIGGNGGAAGTGGGGNGAAGAGGAGLIGSGLTVTNTGTIQGGAGPGTAGNAITFTGGTNVLNFGGTITGNLGVLGGTLQINAATGGSTVANTITGAGGVIQNSANTLTLSGTNTYTGGTTISQGTVSITNAGALGSGTATLSGGTLQSNIAAPSTLVNNITFSPSTASTVSNAQTAINTLTLTGLLTVQSGSTVRFGTAGDTGTIIFQGTTAGNTSPTLAVNGGVLRAGNANLNTLTTNLTSTTVASGATLDLAGFPATIKNLQGSGTVQQDGGTLTVNAGSFAGVIQNGSAALALTKATSGTLVLSGANTYTGATTISAGTLVAANATALGTTAGGTTVASGATLQVQGGITTAEALNLTGTGTASNGALENVSGANTVSGAITLGGAARINSTGAMAGDRLTLTGGIDGAAAATALTLGGDGNGSVTTTAIGGSVGALTKDGAGTWLLSTANTYTGTTTISAGTLQLGNATALNTGIVAFGNSSTGTLDLNGISPTLATLNSTGLVGTVTNSSATASTVTVGSGTFGGVINNGASSIALTKNTGGTLTLTGANTYTGATTVTNGTLRIGDNTTAGDAGRIGQNAGGTVFSNVAVTTPGILAFNRTSAYTYGGVITGTGTVNQTGSGTTTLTGNNSAGNNFTGAVAVNAGTLSISGTFGDTAANAATVTVNTGGILHGTGTIRGTVINAGGTISAGNSPGTVTFASHTVNSGTELFELSAPGVVGGAGNDLINVTNALTINGGTLSLVNATNTANPVPTGLYRLYTYGTLTNGTSTTDGFATLSGTPTYRLINSANAIDVRVGAAPRIQFWDGGDATGATAGAQGGTGTFAPGNVNWVDNSGTTPPTAAATTLRDAFQGGEGVFGATAGTVTVTGANSFQRFDFTTTGYTLANGGGGTLNLTTDTDLGVNPTNSFSLVTLATPAGGATSALGTIFTDTGVTATINTPLTSTTGTIGLLKAGTGTLQLGATNTYTGDTRIEAGTLQVTAGAGIPDASRVILGSTAANAPTLLVSASETIATVESVDPTVAAGAVSVAAAQTLTMAGNGSTSYGGVFVAPAGSTVTKTGTGTLTLTSVSANTTGSNFLGTFNVNGGALALNGVLGDVAAPGNTAALAVAAAGTLEGTGTFRGNATINGTLSPGATGVGSVGTLAIGGTLTINGGSTSNFDLVSPGVRGSTNDLVTVGGALTVNGGTLALSNAAVSGVYRLFDAGSIAGVGFTTVTATNGTAAAYTAPVPGAATQLNARVSLGNQIVQFWDGTDFTGVPGGTTGAQGGTGTWNNTFTNWTNEGGASATQSNTATTGGDVNDSWRSQVGVFAGTAGTVTLGATVNVQGLQFTTDGYTIAASPPFAINLTGDPQSTPNQSFFNIDGGVTTTVNSAITGNAGIGLRKIGAGTLVLGGASTYPGATTVDNGTLTVAGGGTINGTSNVTNNAVLNINAGGAVTTAGAVLNNAGATFNVQGTLTGGSITNAGTFGVTGNATAATVANNSGGTFNSAGTVNGTTSVTNNGNGTFNLSAGTVTTPTFSNNGPLNSTGGQIAAPTFTNTAIVNGVLQLVGNTTATNTAVGTINNGLNITAAAGGATFNNAGTTGTGGLVVGNTGGTLVANNTGTFFGSIASAAGTTTTINNTATWNYQGTSTLAGLDTINTSSLFRVTAAGGTLNGLETFNNTGSGRVELNGDLGGPITTFNNNANGNNGGVYLQGRSIGNVGTFNNNAFLSAVTGAGGNNNSIGAATFNNNAAGTISLVNGVTTDRLTLGGNYNGTAGSRIAVDVNLSQAAGMRSDVVAINGQNNGTTTLVVNRVDNRGVFFSTPVQVITASGGASNVQLSQPIQGNGIVTFDLVQNSPGSYQIVSRLNVAAAAGAAGSITSLITALNVGFFQSVSAFIGAPSANTDDKTASTSTGNSEMSWAQLNEKSAQNSTVSATPGIRPNTISGGLFARGSGGQFAISANNTAIFPGASTVARTKVETTFGGFQFGGDAGLFNIDNTGWNVHLGVTGGEVMATGTQKFGTTTTGNFNVPFIGLYTAFTNGPFFSDLSYRHDFYDAKITDALAGVSQQRISLQSNTVAASAGYRFDFENLFGTENPYFIEPSGSISFTHTNVGNFAVNGGNLRFSDIDSILPRAGVRVGTAFLASDQVALQPFVTLSVLHEFGESVRTRFEANTLATDPNAFVPILTQRVGTFGQVGVGASAQILDTPILGYVRGDVRFGDRIDGYALNAGIRYQF